MRAGILLSSAFEISAQMQALDGQAEIWTNIAIDIRTKGHYSCQCNFGKWLECPGITPHIGREFSVGTSPARKASKTRMGQLNREIK
jgi:hypothetical protein